MDKELKQQDPIILSQADETLTPSQTLTLKDTKRNMRVWLKPAAATTTTLHISSWSEDITWLNICNTGATTTVWIYIVPNGWTAWDSNAIWSSVTLQWNETKIWSEWITPQRWDIIQVKSTSGNVTFTLFGKK